MNKIYIIGIGYKPLEKRAREIILKSSIIVANNRLVEVFRGYKEYKKVKDKIKVINNVDETMAFIRTQITEHRTQNTDEKNLGSGFCALGSDIVLLSSGDPMFHGIGRRAVNEFGKEKVEIFPDLSSIQLAFSRIKEPWDDAFLISLHRSGNLEKNKYEIDDIPVLLTKHHKIAILTNTENNPSEIAKTLLKSQISTPNSEIMMYVFERLGLTDEKIIEGPPDDIFKREFLTPNVVILQNRRKEENQ